MKPFNLEKAADGEPVMTKSGLPARVICVDANNSWEGISERLCVVALVEKEGFETLRRYNESGECHSVSKDENGVTVVKTYPELDLVMKTQKYEGWINIYPAESGRCKVGCTIIYPTKEDAENAIGGYAVGTIKIEWEM